MVICPKCNIEYEAGKRFCKVCGSLLLNEEGRAPGFEGIDSARGEKTKRKLLCSKCQELYEIGTYCRKCGALLMERTTSEEADAPPLEKSSVKRWSKEWLKLIEEKRKLEACISQLETQRDKVSGDLFNPMFLRYQDGLESLSSRNQEIEMKLESIKKRTFEEIELLERILKPIQKRFEEVQSLYRLGAMTKTDFSTEKNIMRKEIKAREKNLRKHRQIISLLPSQMGGSMVSPRMVRDLLRPLPLMIVCAIIMLVVLGGYFIWQRPSQSSGLISEEIVSSHPDAPSPQNRSTGMEGQEVGRIRSLFENIRHANLQENIDLFMSCYSRDFKERKEKRLATLAAWKKFNYLDLSYDLKKQTITGDTADVSVEWLIRTSPKAGGQTRESRSVLNVTLKREEGDWKIKEIKSVS